MLIDLDASVHAEMPSAAFRVHSMACLGEIQRCVLSSPSSMLLFHYPSWYYPCLMTWHHRTVLDASSSAILPHQASRPDLFYRPAW